MRTDTLLTGSQIQQIRTALAEREARLTMMLANVKQEALQELSLDAAGDVSHRHTHPADTGAMEYDQSLALDSLERVRRQLSEVQAAKSRLALGNYGVCLECEERVAMARLLQVPEARFCGACQRAFEESEKLHRHQPRLSLRENERTEANE